MKKSAIWNMALFGVSAHPNSVILRSRAAAMARHNTVTKAIAQVALKPLAYHVCWCMTTGHACGFRC